MDTTVLIIAVASALGGLVLGRLLMVIKANNIIKAANAKAKAIQRKAHQQSDRLKKDKILQAKERFLELKGEHEKVILKREKKILEVENRVKDKEAKLNNELNRTKSLSKNLEDKSATLNLKLEKLEGQKRTLDQQLEQQIQKLEELSGYSAEQAKEELVQSLKDRANASAEGLVVCRAGPPCGRSCRWFWQVGCGRRKLRRAASSARRLESRNATAGKPSRC